MSNVGGAAQQQSKDVDLAVGSLLVLVLDVNPDQRIFFGKSFSKMSGRCSTQNYASTIVHPGFLPLMYV